METSIVMPPRPLQLPQLPHWDYFLALCRDFQETTHYVELVSQNFPTYSTAFARLYLAAGSEIDVVAKLLCQSVNPTSTDKNIDQYRETIVSKYPDLPNVEVELPRHKMERQPWKSWSTGSNPTWWRSYNEVKHERNRHFDKANLENTLDAIAALFVLLAYLHHEDLRKSHLIPLPELMAFPTKYWDDQFFVSRAIFRLPGIPKP